MSRSTSLVFFHNPQSRSSMVRALLEELGAEFELCSIDFRKQEQLSPEFLTINPMGKVPAISHNGVVVTENVAIYIYLSDLYRDKGLSPGLDDPDRGPWLRWLVFYAACFEPAIGDRAMHREPAPRMQSAYADYDTVIKTLRDQLSTGPWLLGERFSSTADVLWGAALRYAIGFKMVESDPVFDAYVERVMARPASQRTDVANQDLSREMGLAV